MTSRSQPIPPPAQPKTQQQPQSGRPGFNRNRSLRLPTQPPADIPIPPSLLAKAPHLVSPNASGLPPASGQNMVPRPYPYTRNPKTPSREDEEWLADTIPASQSRTKDPYGGMIVVVRRDGSTTSLSSTSSYGAPGSGYGGMGGGTSGTGTFRDSYFLDVDTADSYGGSSASSDNGRQSDSDQ